MATAIAETVAAPLPAASKSAWPLSLAAIALTLGAGVAFLFLLDIPFIRSTGLPNFAAMVLGCLMALAALQRRPRWAAAGATLICAALTGLFAFGLYFTSLPAPASGTAAASAPAEFDLELVDADEKKVRLREYQSKGPLLLVFYRGFW